MQTCQRLLQTQGKQVTDGHRPLELPWLPIIPFETFKRRVDRLGSVVSCGSPRTSRLPITGNSEAFLKPGWFIPRTFNTRILPYYRPTTILLYTITVSFFHTFPDLPFYCCRMLWVRSLSSANWFSSSQPEDVEASASLSVLAPLANGFFMDAYTLDSSWFSTEPKKIISTNFQKESPFSRTPSCLALPPFWSWSCAEDKKRVANANVCTSGETAKNGPCRTVKESGTMTPQSLQSSIEPVGRGQRTGVGKRTTAIDLWINKVP